MYEVSVEAGFSAAHRVRLASGELEPLHGHDWRVRAVFSGAKLDAAGMLVDFVAAERALGQVVAKLHHADLNSCPAMNGLNPTAEHVAQIIYGHLAAEAGLAEALRRVEVTEAPGCRAAYTGPGGVI